MAQQRYIQCVEPFLHQFGQRVPKRVQKMIEALATIYGGVRMRLRRAPLTMIHDDLHLDNMLFSAAPSIPPLMIIDWQRVARVRAAIDVASVLFGSLETATH